MSVTSFKSRSNDKEKSSVSFDNQELSMIRYVRTDIILVV